LEEFLHPDLNRVVEFFGGSYVLIEAGRIEYQGKEVLYFIGVAGLEASCCGRSGCAFAKVPGFIHRCEMRRDESGRMVSEVERITAPKEQGEISRLLQEKYPQVTQIEFL
jgi:hypothetical protein